MRKEDIAPRMAEIWETLPESARKSARAEMVLIQDFMEAAVAVPEAEMAPLRAEFDRCLAQYVTPTPPCAEAAPAKPAPAAKPSDEEIHAAIAQAAVGCFDTTVDESVERADHLAHRARDAGRGRLHEMTRNPLRRRRLMKRLDAEIARERATVIY